MGQVASCYHTKLITTIPYLTSSPSLRARVPRSLGGYPPLTRATEYPGSLGFKLYTAPGRGEVCRSFYQNRKPTRIFIPDHPEEIYAGFSMKSILDVLKKVSPEDPLKPLIDNIVNGNIYGIAAIVGCPNPKTRKLFTERMAKELIKLTANLAL